MDLALLVYAISLLDGLRTFLIFIAVLAGLVTVVCAIYTATWYFEGHEYSWNCDGNDLKPRIKQARETMQRGLKYGLVTFICLLPLPNLVPSEKTAYTMVGAYAAQKVAENPQVQQISGKVITIINQKLDHYVEQGIKEAEDGLRHKSSKKEKSSE